MSTFGERVTCWESLKGPKSVLDEDREDGRARVSPTARTSSAEVGRNEGASMGLVVLCPPSPMTPSPMAFSRVPGSRGSEGDP
jgi:hypothetical protein